MESINLYESLKPSIVELGISALNGVMGDQFQRKGSVMAIEMGYYHQNRRLELTTEQLEKLSPQASSKIAIFVHGLCSHEQLWCFPKEDESAEDRFSYGSLLLRELGYTPFYLRFNSGLRIADNGERFAALIEKLLQVYPTPVDEIVLFGHSLGGLVIRSACHFGEGSASTWISKLNKAFYIGSPHLGTPWEDKTDHLYRQMAQSTHPLARTITQIYQSRSLAIRDLRYPHLVDEDRQRENPHRPTSLPWLTDTTHHFVSAKLMRNPDHPVNHYIGDGLVPVSSAHGHQDAHELEPCIPGAQRYSVVISGINHLRIAHSPQVYSHIKRWMEDDYAHKHMEVNAVVRHKTQRSDSPLLDT